MDLPAFLAPWSTVPLISTLTSAAADGFTCSDLHLYLTPAVFFTVFTCSGLLHFPVVICIQQWSFISRSGRLYLTAFINHCFKNKDFSPVSLQSCLAKVR